MNPVFSCQNLGFSYSGVPVLDIEFLQIRPGRVVVIQGPNGAGKSTLLWLFAGLLRPERGSITLLGQTLNARLDGLRHHVTLVMEEPYLLRTSVQRNLEYGLARHGLKRRNRAESVARALRLVGLEEYGRAKTWELSHGEKKRVALARGLALHTDVLLLDEPTSHVDRHSAHLIERAIERIRGNTTVVISTHDIAQARRLADEIVTLVDGRLYDISHENLMEVETICRGGQRFAVLSDYLEIPLAPGPEGVFWILLDPSKIRLSPATEGCSEFAVTDLSVERDSVRIRLEAGLNLVARVPLEPFHSMAMTVGQTCSIEIPPDAVRVLEHRAGREKSAGSQQCQEFGAGG